MKTHEYKYRHVILLLNCLLVFGTYFTVDMPSALQTELESGQDLRCHTMNFTNAGTQKTKYEATCCTECFGLGPSKYTLLYTSIFWTSAFMSLPSGYLIDRLGNSVSAILIILITSTGSALFALATMPSLRMSDAMLPLMILGRILSGFGDGPVRIVQDRLISAWYPDDSFMPIALVVLTRRAGNMLNFLITARLASSVGLTMSLWFGSVLCCIGILCAVLMAYLNESGTQMLDTECQNRLKSKPISLGDVTSLPKQYWLHLAMIGFFFCSFFTFVAVSPRYFQGRYGFNMVDASIINGLSYFVPVFLSPFIAIILKRLECNGLAATISTVFAVPVLLLVAFVPSIPPYVLTTLFGIIYNVDVIIMWQVPMNLIPTSVFGTATGIGMFLVRLGIGGTNLVVGRILGDSAHSDVDITISKYQSTYMLLAALSVASVTCGVTLNIWDFRSGFKINRRFQTKRALPCIDNSEMSQLLSDDNDEHDHIENNVNNHNNCQQVFSSHNHDHQNTHLLKRV